MHTLLGCLLVVAAFRQLDALPASNGQVEIEGRTSFEDDLRELVEFLRLQMKCGYPAAGIPPLAPYQTDYAEFKFQTALWHLRGNFTDLTISGLDEFDVRLLSWNNAIHKLKFDLNFGKILFKGGYMLDAITRMFGPSLRFYGDGELYLALENLHATGSFLLRPTLSGSVRMQAFKMQLELGNAESKSTGIMNNALLTKIFNSWIEEFLQLVFDDSVDEVSAALEYLIVPPMNRVLANVSIVEVLKLMFGLADGTIPNESLC